MTTKKKPSLQTQLKNAKAELAAAQQKIAQLQKELDSNKGTITYNHGRAERAEGELQQIHAFLDAVPNPPARKTDPTVTDYARDVTALTRLTVFLATR